MQKENDKANMYVIALDTDSHTPFPPDTVRERLYNNDLVVQHPTWDPPAISPWK